jgi:hypothetical protein
MVLTDASYDQPISPESVISRIRADPLRVTRKPLDDRPYRWTHGIRHLTDAPDDAHHEDRTMNGITAGHDWRCP